MKKTIDQQAIIKKMFLKIKELETEIAKLNEPIAVIGMGCRFPGGANSPESFWERLLQGYNPISEIPRERWDINHYFDHDPLAKGKMYTKYGAFIDKIDHFDPEFFGIAPREAEKMDPQQKLFLSVAWEGLENAGQAVDQLHDSKTGVFLGIGSHDFASLLLRLGDESLDPYFGPGTHFSIAAGRLSYLLGLHGPSMAVDTACSSSLVAFHLACKSLQNNECDLAISGGVHLMISPELMVSFCKARMLSVDGKCKTFDASADGFGRGEGCGVLILKRYSDAIANKDNILAIVKGSNVNQDGRTAGLTAPNRFAQENLIRETLKKSKVPPEDVSYIECHGTGTILGDPIEITALQAVFEANHNKQNPLYIGSVKTNISHLESASGSAGLIKTILSMNKETIPPHINYSTLNPHIDIDKDAFVIPKQKVAWTNPNKKIAGISSFGYGGTNSFVLVESTPLKFNPKKPSNRRGYDLLTISAKSEAELSNYIAKYVDFLKQNKEENFQNICFTANSGRSQFSHRLALVASSTEDCYTKLCDYLSKNNSYEVSKGVLKKEKKIKVAYYFSDNFHIYKNIAQSLYDEKTIFRRSLKQCDELTQNIIGFSILNSILNGNEDNNQSYNSLVCFSLQYSLAKLWIACGIKPQLYIYDGTGEYVARCIVGHYPLQEAIKLIIDPSLDGVNNDQLVTDPSNVELIAGNDAREQLKKYLVVSLGPGKQDNISVYEDITLITHFDASSGSWRKFLLNLSKMFVIGAKFECAEIYQDDSVHRVALPTYPFQERRVWIHEEHKTFSGRPIKPKLDIDNVLKNCNKIPNNRPYNLLSISAKEERLSERFKSNLLKHLNVHPNTHISDVAYALHVSKDEFPYRQFFICNNALDAKSMLQQATASLSSMEYGSNVLSTKGEPKIVFLCSGVGEHYINMGRGLYEIEPFFRQQIDKCSKLLNQHLGKDIRTVLFSNKENEDSKSLLNQTEYLQAAVFIIGYASAMFWMECGIKPAALIGHSTGEYLAACLSGVLTLKDALYLLVKRAKIINKLPTGMMLAVPMRSEDLISYLKNSDISLGAVNGPSLCVVSGTLKAITKLEKQLLEEYIITKRLPVNHPFHSETIALVQNELLTLFKSIKFKDPKIPYISNLTGNYISSEEARSPGYWYMHTKNTVLFSQGIKRLIKNNSLFLEVGPGRNLVSAVLQHQTKDINLKGRTFNSIRNTIQEHDDYEYLLNTMGNMWLQGIKINWNCLYCDSLNHNNLSHSTFDKKYYCSTLKNEDYAGAKSLSKLEATEEFLHSVQTMDEKEKPKGELEKKLTEIWTKNLGVSKIGRDDNYLSLGGDSIKAIYMIAELKKNNLSLKVRDIFTNPVLKDLAKVIKKNKEPANNPTINSGENYMTLQDKWLNKIKKRMLGRYNRELTIENIYPITSAQERILIQSLFYKNNSFYLTSQSYVLEGNVNIDLLKQSFIKLVERHESLRSNFDYNIKSSTGIQIVFKSRIVEIPFYDISNLNASAQKNKIKNFINLEAEVGIDLTKENILRLSIFKSHSNKYDLVFTFCQIGMDGWSFQILIKEFIEIYFLLLNKQTINLPAPPSLGLYYSWYEKYNKSLPIQFWTKYLSGYNHDANSVFKESQAESKRNMKQKEIKLDADTSERINNFIKSNKITLTTLLTCLWGIVLGYLFKKKDVVFGLTVSGRTTEIFGIENMFGLFLNVIPIRISLANMSIIEMLFKLQKAESDIMDNSYAPLPLLIKKLGLSNKFITHIMTIQNFYNEEEIFETLKSNGSAFTFQISDGIDNIGYNLNFMVNLKPTISFRYYYNSNVVDKNKIDEASKIMLALIEIITSNAKLTIQEINKAIPGVLADTPVSNITV